LIAGLCILLASPADGAFSLGFSTGQQNNYSWTLTVQGGVASMSFTNNDIDACSIPLDPILNDRISLPTMTLTNMQTVNLGPGINVITALLIPNASPVAIYADVASPPAAAGAQVLSASVGTGGMLTVGTNFIAYSNQQDDLNVLSHMAGYSTVIDGFVAAENAGFDIDLSFGGDASTPLYNLLSTLNNGSISGTLSGQIVAVPEPFTVILLGMGGLVLLRKRFN